MNPWIDELGDDLKRLASGDLLRQLNIVEPEGCFVVVRGRRLLNLASNDYLGLSGHPALKKAAVDAIQQFGTGTGASRLVSGHRPAHEATEARFAAFKHTEAALLFPTGYMANLAVLGALAGPGDLICSDKLNHASILDAARLSMAELRVYPHRSVEKLERLLARHQADQAGAGPRTNGPIDRDPQAGEISESGSDSTRRQPRRFIVTDSVFSMDGDVSDLAGL